MSQESTNADLAVPVRNLFAFENRRAYAELEGLFGADSVLDLSRQGLGTYEGAQTIRAFWEDWIEVYEDFVLTAVDAADLGHGVVVTVNRHRGRPRHSSAEVILDNAWVLVSGNGVIHRWTAFNDTNEAHAAAGQLAQGRG
jgi:ketosteroid isomerase-like protein